MSNALTKAHILEFKKVFGLIDNYSEGLITMEEVAKVIQTQDRNTIPTKQEVEGMMTLCQEFGNIDFNDFLNIMTRKMKENVDDETREAFKVFDRDQDGFISANDLRQVMINLGERLTMEEAEQMINEADLNGDGVVSYEEFVKMMAMTILPL